MALSTALLTDRVLMKYDWPKTSQWHRGRSLYSTWIFKILIISNEVIRIKPNEADRHKSRAPGNRFPTDGPTDQPTNQRTNRPTDQPTDQPT